MIKFEEQDGLIFRMLDKPTPLTPETEMPCLVRLIQDDSPMGKHNKDLHEFDPERLTPRICTEVIDVNDLSDPNRGSARCDGLMSIQYYRYELIGTHVKEGSDDWAWHQMMQGEKISGTFYKPQRFYAIKKGCDYCALYENDGNEVRINTRRTYGEFIEYSKRHHISWQIYKESKLPKEQKIDSGKKEYTCLVCGKKMSGLDGMAEVSIKRISISNLYESTLSHYCGSCFLKLGFDATEKELRSRQQPNPEPTFKIGDWVDCKDPVGVPTQCKVLEILEHNVIVECKTGHRWSLPHNNIIRKLSPADIVIRIGCLSGTVRRINDIFFCLNPSTKKGWVVPEATIPLAMLDTPTREIVESLLKAQE